MAERGFLTIAFDPSYTGESGGTPRYVASPDINTEDFCAAVTPAINNANAIIFFISFVLIWPMRNQQWY